MLIMVIIIIGIKLLNINIKPNDIKLSHNTNEKDWLDELFDRKQIITIPTRVKNVSNFCKSLKINETIFNAILKNNLNYNNVYKLKIGEIACALSQEKVLQEFVSSDDKTLLMFEDDVMPITHEMYVNSGITLNHIKSYINKCVTYLPNNWDVMYFGRCWDSCSNHVKINKYIVCFNILFYMTKHYH